jgi:hypothetical protein
MTMSQSQVAWWNTSKEATVFGVDPRVLVPMLFWLLDFTSGWKFWLSFFCVVLMLVLRHAGTDIGGLGRRLRRKLAGPVASGHPWYMRTRY